MKKELTSRQEDILNFISDYIEFNGFPPTYREIGKQFNISSTFGVKRHLDALSKKGYLNVEGNVSRALTLTKTGSSVTQNSSSIELIELPVVGRVAAGQPIPLTRRAADEDEFLIKIAVDGRLQVPQTDLGAR